MSKTIKLEVDNVLKAYKEGSDSDKKLLERMYPELFPKDITERVKTLEEACKELGVDYTSFLAQISSQPKDVAAYQKVRLIVEALNEGWSPDWGKSSEYKYRPWFKFVPGSGFAFVGCNCVYSGSTVGSRLCFKSEALCNHAVTHFLPEYQDLFNY